jgi:hypothetical protein
MESNNRILDDLFFGNPPPKENLINTLKNILRNIEQVKAIPIENRKYESD